jgi:hypothetical protein
VISLSGAVGAATGSAVGETTLAGVPASALSEVFGTGGAFETGGSGSEIGTSESSDASQAVVAGV